jgi:hypothetical protein
MKTLMTALITPLTTTLKITKTNKRVLIFILKDMETN